MRLVPILFYYSFLFTLFHLPRSINSQCKCEKGWNVGLETQQVCYLFKNETGNVTWTQSKLYCNKKHNATLPMPKDVNMAYLLFKLSFLLKRDNHSWNKPFYALGLQFNSRQFNFSEAQNVSKAWVWEDGTPLSTMEVYPWWWDPNGPYTSGLVSPRAYARIGVFTEFDNMWFFGRESLEKNKWNLINVCQKSCSNPPSSTLTVSSTSTQSQSSTSTQSQASMWFVIVGSVLFLIALLVISILLGYRKGKENAKKSMLGQNGNFEMMSSTGNPELDAIKTVDLFGGSSSSHNPPSTNKISSSSSSAIVPLTVHDAESCPSLSYPEVHKT